MEKVQYPYLVFLIISANCGKMRLIVDLKNPGFYAYL
tara:strand:+ start:107 stop:217 length:111 start_codon:yes stop_codon:yes gene_type:complete